MGPNITKETVELYILGALQPNRRRQVEEAFKNNPQISKWFVELGELPTPIKAEQATMGLLEHLAPASVTTGGSRGSETELPAPKPAPIPPSPNPTKGSVQIFEFKDDTLALSAAPPELPVYSTGPSGKEICELHDGDICIDCPVSDIPYGLVKVTIREEDGTYTTYLPELEVADGRWASREPLFDLLGGRPPATSSVDVCVERAMLENRSTFMGDEVRDFIDSLPSDSDQQRLARAYLKMDDPTDE